MIVVNVRRGRRENAFPQLGIARSTGLHSTLPTTPMGLAVSCLSSTLPGVRSPVNHQGR